MFVIYIRVSCWYMFLILYFCEKYFESDFLNLVDDSLLLLFMFQILIYVSYLLFLLEMFLKWLFKFCRWLFSYIKYFFFFFTSVYVFVLVFFSEVFWSESLVNDSLCVVFRFLVLIYVFDSIFCKKCFENDFLSLVHDSCDISDSIFLWEVFGQWYFKFSRWFLGCDIFVSNIGICFLFSLLWECFENDLNLVDDFLAMVYLFMMLVYFSDSIFCEKCFKSDFLS